VSRYVDSDGVEWEAFYYCERAEDTGWYVHETEYPEEGTLAGPLATEAEADAWMEASLHWSGAASGPVRKVLGSCAQCDGWGSASEGTSMEECACRGTGYAFAD
jgi:hypothetical protein